MIQIMTAVVYSASGEEEEEKRDKGNSGAKERGNEVGKRRGVSSGHPVCRCSRR